MTGRPIRRGAFDAFAPALAGLGATEVPFPAQVSLRVDPAVAAIELPTTPNTWSAAGARETLWLGPDEWLVVSDTEPAEAIVRDLEARLGDAHRSVLDVSSNRAVLELTGDDRLDLLASGCALDLHPRAWRSGVCAQTLLARVPVLLQERPGATRLFVRPSFAGYLATWMRRVAENR